eukprot:CAMPEP_0206295280 /NCGR_PEP_ID=MMETSP0106_2-20121207/5084_1 /ASSEMBLY_ACC=CAM_ASM_000206 /TAXON_ID=81532 /ORGANISM="Acanthoeca-like sp., Strain 10tr" /LENGTH=2505 /DNA_ID=CAMNT_0053725927 /DNA_START=33 /DNA_END=7547 /DNA_ORIENTATION=+
MENQRGASQHLEGPSLRSVVVNPLRPDVTDGCFDPITVAIPHSSTVNDATSRIFTAIESLDNEHPVRMMVDKSMLKPEHCSLYDWSEQALIAYDNVADSHSYIACCEQDWKLELTQEQPGEPTLLSEEGDNLDEVRWLNSFLYSNASQKAVLQISYPNSGWNTTIQYELMCGTHGRHTRRVISGGTTTNYRVSRYINDLPPIREQQNLAVSKEVLEGKYDTPPRSAPKIEAPLAEIAYDNAATAYLASASGNPPLNVWVCEELEAEIMAGLQEPLDERWVAFKTLNIHQDPASPSQLKGWPANEDAEKLAQYSVIFDHKKYAIEGGEVCMPCVDAHVLFVKSMTGTQHKLSLTRHEIEREVTVDILVDERAVVAFDKGPGMTSEDIKNLMDYAGTRKKRGFSDRPPTGKFSTHGLTALISQFGVGAKNAAFFMGPKELGGGFIYRTMVRGVSTVTEISFTGEGMKRKEKAGLDWKTAGERTRLAAKGDLHETKIPQNVLRHPRVQELIKGETDRASGTIVVIINVTDELLHELITSPGCDSRILHPTDKTGFQYMSERLAAQYHWLMHGFYGRVRSDGSRLRAYPRETSVGADDALPEPHPAALAKGHSGWTIKMNLNLHHGDTVKSRKLHDMMTDDAEEAVQTDPVAAVLDAAAKSAFRFRATLSNYKHHPDEVFDFDVVLVYCRHNLEGETWSTLFESTGSVDGVDARPLPGATCLSYWEGRQVPFGELNLDIFKTANGKGQAYLKLKGVPDSALSRVRGFVFMRRQQTGEQCISKTKQSFLRSVEKILNATIASAMDERGTIDGSGNCTTFAKGAFCDGFKDAKPEIRFIRDSQRGGKFKTSLIKWVNECTKEDEICLVTSHAIEHAIIRVEIPPFFPDWELTNGSDLSNPPRVVGWSAKHLEEQPLHKEVTVTDTNGKEHVLQRVGAVAQSPSDLSVSFRQRKRERSLVKVGSKICFVCRANANSNSNVLLGQVTEIFPMDKNGEYNPSHGETNEEDGTILSTAETVTFNVRLLTTLWDGPCRYTVVDARDVCFVLDGTDGLQGEWQRVKQGLLNENREVFFFHPSFPKNGQLELNIYEWLTFFEPLNDHSCRDVANQDDFLALDRGAAPAKLPERAVRVVPIRLAREQRDKVNKRVNDKLRACGVSWPPNPTNVSESLTVSIPRSWKECMKGSVPGYGAITDVTWWLFQSRPPVEVAEEAGTVEKFKLPKTELELGHADLRKAGDNDDLMYGVKLGTEKGSSDAELYHAVLPVNVRIKVRPGPPTNAKVVQSGGGLEFWNSHTLSVNVFDDYDNPVDKNVTLKIKGRHGFSIEHSPITFVDGSWKVPDFVLSPLANEPGSPHRNALRKRPETVKATVDPTHWGHEKEFDIDLPIAPVALLDDLRVRIVAPKGVTTNRTMAKGFKLRLVDNDGFAVTEVDGQLTYRARLDGQEWPDEPTDVGNQLDAKVVVGFDSVPEGGKATAEFAVYLNNRQLQFADGGDGLVCFDVVPNPKRVVKLLPEVHAASVFAEDDLSLHFRLLAETGEKLHVDEAVSRQLKRGKVEVAVAATKAELVDDLEGNWANMDIGSGLDAALSVQTSAPTTSGTYWVSVRLSWKPPRCELEDRLVSPPCEVRVNPGPLDMWTMTAPQTVRCDVEFSVSATAHDEHGNVVEVDRDTILALVLNTTQRPPGQGIVGSIEGPVYEKFCCTFKCRLAGEAKRIWDLTLCNQGRDGVELASAPVTMEHGNLNSFKLTFLDTPHKKRDASVRGGEVKSTSTEAEATANPCVVTAGLLCSEVVAVDSFGNVVDDFGEPVTVSGNEGGMRFVRGTARKAIQILPAKAFEESMIRAFSLKLSPQHGPRDFWFAVHPITITDVAIVEEDGEYDFNAGESYAIDEEYPLRAAIKLSRPMSNDTDIAAVRWVLEHAHAEFISTAPEEVPEVTVELRPAEQVSDLEKDKDELHVSYSSKDPKWTRQVTSANEGVYGVSLRCPHAGKNATSNIVEFDVVASDAVKYGVLREDSTEGVQTADKKKVIRITDEDGDGSSSENVNLTIVAVDEFGNAVDDADGPTQPIMLASSDPRAVPTNVAFVSSETCEGVGVEVKRQKDEFRFKISGDLPSVTVVIHGHGAPDVDPRVKEFFKDFVAKIDEVSEFLGDPSGRSQIKPDGVAVAITGARGKLDDERRDLTDVIAELETKRGALVRRSEVRDKVKEARELFRARAVCRGTGLGSVKSLLYVRDDSGCSLADDEMELLRRCIPQGCIGKHLMAQLILHGHVVDEPSVPLEFGPCVEGDGVNVDWLREKEHLLTEDVTELVVFALADPDEVANAEWAGSRDSEWTECPLKDARQTRNVILQKEVIVRGGVGDAIKLYEEYRREAGEGAVLPPVLCLSPPHAVSPTGLAVPLNVDGPDVLPRWPDGVLPEDFSFGDESDNEKDVDVELKDAQDRLVQCLAYDGELGALKTRWVELTKDGAAQQAVEAGACVERNARQQARASAAVRRAHQAQVKPAQQFRTEPTRHV